MPFNCHYVQIRSVIAIFSFFCFLFSTGCDSPLPEQPDEKSVSFEHRDGQLTILVPWSHVGAAEKLAQLYYEETGTVVHLIKVEYFDLLTSSLKDFRSPAPKCDVYQLWYANLGRLAEDGIILSLTDFYQKYTNILDTVDLIPHFFDEYTLYNNKRWAVPFDGDIHVLFYRKSLLAKYDFTPPKTWQEYLDISRHISEHEKDNNIYGAAFMGYPTPFLIIGSFLNRLGGFGGKLIDDNQKPKIDTPEAAAALDAMVQHARYALPTPLETDFAVARDAFIQGRVAMVEQWTDLGIMAEDPRQSIIGGDWGVVPIPVAQDVKNDCVAPLNGGWSLAISTKSPKREMAEQFLAFSIRKDVTLKLNLIPGGGGLDPVRKSTIASPDFEAFAPQISKVEKQLLNGDFVSFPKHPLIPDILDDLTQALVAALEERLSPIDALKECQKKWDEKIANRK